MGSGIRLDQSNRDVASPKATTFALDASSVLSQLTFSLKLFCKDDCTKHLVDHLIVICSHFHFVVFIRALGVSCCDRLLPHLRAGKFDELKISLRIPQEQGQPFLIYETVGFVDDLSHLPLLVEFVSFRIE